MLWTRAITLEGSNLRPREDLEIQEALQPNRAEKDAQKAGELADRACAREDIQHHRHEDGVHE
jgi:hypothetical protein